MYMYIYTYIHTCIHKQVRQIDPWEEDIWRQVQADARSTDNASSKDDAISTCSSTTNTDRQPDTSTQDRHRAGMQSPAQTHQRLTPVQQAPAPAAAQAHNSTASGSHAPKSFFSSILTSPSPVNSTDSRQSSHSGRHEPGAGNAAAPTGWGSGSAVFVQQESNRHVDEPAPAQAQTANVQVYLCLFFQNV